MAERIFLERRPDLLEINVLAIRVLPKRLGVQVNVHRPGESKGDDQRRRHQKIGADVLVYASLEVAIARQDAGSHEIIFGDGFLERGMQRARISDAGCAAVADCLKAELVESKAGDRSFRDSL